MLKKTKTIILALTVFLFPLFFLSCIQDPFVTNKLYFLGLMSLLLILVSVIELISTKKFVWQSKPFDKLVILFLAAISLSIVIVSPNKIQALLNINLGLIKILPLIIIYYYLAREKDKLVLKAFYFGSFVVALISALFVFQPFKNITLPASLQILKLPNFTPLGNYLELAVFLGFIVVWELAQIFFQKNDHSKKKTPLSFSFLAINLLVLIGALILLFTPLKNQESLLNMVFYPFRLAWYSAVEIMKNPWTALFGIGVDNYSAIFTRVKDVAYNQSSLWQINYFTISRSLLLHIFTEAGFLGLITFSMILFALLRFTREKHSLYLPLAIYMILIVVILPPTLVSLFLLFVVLGLAAQESNHQTTTVSLKIPLIILLALVGMGFIGSCGYLLGRSYLAEYYYQKSNEGINQNNIKIVYDNLKNALILNPYSEKFATDFSRINLQYALNMIIFKNQKKEVLNEQERTSVTQAIQQAIMEAKRVVNLNPQKAANWENLALVYKNIINIAQGADVWTISAYQRAVIADPQNPIYRISLGGIYYSLNNFEEAIKYFEQAITLKPDWPNAYYNMAWANYQQNNITKAVNAMENVVKLLNSTNNQTDAEKAQADLEKFKVKLKSDEEMEQASKEAEIKAKELNLPNNPAGVDPKLQIKNNDPHDPE